MGRSRHRFHVLIASGLVAIGACDSVDSEEVPVWTPLDRVDGKFRPEFEQVAIAHKPKRGLRLVSYNVLRGVDVDVDADYFAGHADLAHADVIALQETLRRPGASISDAGQLASRLGMGYVFVPTYDWKYNLHGIALLSRFPLVDVEVMMLNEQTDEAPDRAARAALRATVVTRSGPVHIINVHLDVEINMPERILQLRPVVLDAPPPVAVTGDFNTNDFIWGEEFIPVLPFDAVAATSQAVALDRYMRLIGYATPTSHFGPTWHGFPEEQRLDHVYTRGLDSGAGGVVRGLTASDHWPLWLDIRAPDDRSPDDRAPDDALRPADL